MPAQLLSPGDKIAGKYRILRRLGQGGMGVVFLAEHERLGRQVAIKVLHAQLEQMQVAMVRFEREIRAMAQVNSRHVAQAFDADVLDDGSPFLVMEYLDGRDLRAELKLRRAIPYPEAVAYIVQACEGVAAVHDVGIIHRDLKPNNLFVIQLDAARCVKVLDFGIVKLLSDSDLSMTAENTSVGTPLYMSPEQLNNEKDISPCSDVWALGVVLYELIAGVSPFAADRPGAVVAAIMLEEPPLLSRIVRGIPSQLAETIAEALEKSPGNRIGSAREFAALLAPFGMPTTGIVVASTTPSGQPAKLPRRDSLRPELSARIQREVERGDALALRNAGIRVDELRQLPSLARLSIPLTNVAVPLARRGTRKTAEEERDSSSAAPAATPSVDAATRVELTPKVDVDNRAVDTKSDPIGTGSRRWWMIGAAFVALLVLGLIVAWFWPQLSKPKGIAPVNTPSTSRASTPQDAPSAASDTPGALGAAPLAVPSEARNALSSATIAPGKLRILETASTTSTLTPKSPPRPAASTSRTQAVDKPPIATGQNTPRVTLPQPSPTDGNPAHL